MDALSSQFMRELAEIVGEVNVRRGDIASVIDPGVTPLNLKADVIASPGDTEEVAAVVRLCGKFGVALVPQGGRTGLVGGAISRSGQVILSTGRLNRILMLSPTERVAVVEAGLPLQVLQEAAAELDLEPGIDLPSRGSATIGGMASTNAGGISAFRYGVMRHRILGIEAVLPDGSIYSDLTRVVKNAAGYDLKHLFIGGEGTLGIITRIALKLEPLPPATATILLGLPDVDAALFAVNEGLNARFGSLRAAEAIWKSYFDLTAGHHQWTAPDYAMDHPINLVLALGGQDFGALQDELVRLYEAVIQEFPTSSGVIPASIAQEKEIWRLREDTDLIYRKHPNAPSYDVSVPLSAISSYVTRCIGQLKALDAALDPYVFGHIADGNLHIVLNHAADEVNDGMQAAIEAILYDGLHEQGGSFSAEHGIGSKRIGSLLATANPTKIALMRHIKAALDPEALVNPYKVLS